MGSDDVRSDVVESDDMRARCRCRVVIGVRIEACRMDIVDVRVFMLFA